MVYGKAKTYDGSHITNKIALFLFAELSIMEHLTLSSSHNAKLNGGSKI